MELATNPSHWTAVSHYELAGLRFMAEKLREISRIGRRPGPKGKLGRPRKNEPLV